MEDKNIQLSEKEWSCFEKLLDKANFWKIETQRKQNGADGSEWIIEAHLKNKYRYVNRWPPPEDFGNAGKFLIELNQVKEEIY